MERTRIAMILPGLGRVQRGAETAFLEIAAGLQTFSDIDVHLFGSATNVPEGLSITAIDCTPRERFERYPKLPTLRSECHYEELSYAIRLWRSAAFDPRQFDVTISCTFPWINWFLRLAKRSNRNLKNIFVTQNGDWMCRAGHREYRYFSCDGLVAINPEYHANNVQRHPTVLIPNGTDPDTFFPRASDDTSRLSDLGVEVPADKKVVVMASALIESKRVAEGVRATAKVENAFLVVAGDGPERERVTRIADELIPGRYRFLGSIPRSKMPYLFRNSDVFLHMSQIEPFGIVYLEAAASGLPIVTHDGETPRWILGDAALYADSNQLDHVADAIREAGNQATGEELGLAARQRVIEDWTWKAQAVKYRAFIRRQLGLDTDAQEGENDALDYHRQLQHS